MTSTTMPNSNTPMVALEQPFHSLRMMPHTLENTTLRAIRMQKARVVSTGEDSKKPLPNDQPKNWLYHRPPAMAQKMRLFTHTEPFL